MYKYFKIPGASLTSAQSTQYPPGCHVDTSSIYYKDVNQTTPTLQPTRLPTVSPTNPTPGPTPQPTPPTRRLSSSSDNFHTPYNQPLYLAANLTGTVLYDNTGVKKYKWATHFSIIDWIVFLAIFFDTFGAILKFLPILSGKPTEMESAKAVKCSGKSAFSCVTTVNKLNEALFLRNLIGRTATVFHTIGSRHGIKGP